jgi:hypothetical protein
MLEKDMDGLVKSPSRAPIQQQSAKLFRDLTLRN